MNVENLPAEIGNLTDLTELVLRGTSLISLPPEIGNLTNLTSLTVIGDDDYDGRLTSLPPEIGNLTNLTSLDLKNNQLTQLPPEIGNLTNLTSLNLEHNQLSSLPPEIGKLTNLTSLTLEGNKLSSLPPEIGKLTNLTSLNLKNNQLSSLPAEIYRLTTAINLEGNDELPEEIRKMTRILSSYEQLQRAMFLLISLVIFVYLLLNFGYYLDIALACGVGLILSPCLAYGYLLMGTVALGGAGIVKSKIIEAIGLSGQLAKNRHYENLVMLPFVFLVLVLWLGLPILLAYGAYTITGSYFMAFIIFLAISIALFFGAIWIA